MVWAGMYVCEEGIKLRHLHRCQLHSNSFCNVVSVDYSKPEANFCLLGKPEGLEVG